MQHKLKNFQINKRSAQRTWGILSRRASDYLKNLTVNYGFLIGRGDLIYMDGGWYVTHSGLLALSYRRHCSGIHVEPVKSLCNVASSRYVLKATVYPSKESSGFVGYGDADPFNVSSLVRGAEMRIAETRAVNRALRKAYGIGICSVEEIGSYSAPVERRSEPPAFPPKRTSSKLDGDEEAKQNGNGRKVRDRLCQIIRHHNLDPEQVKRYAVDFCGTNTLKEASREQVESFVEHLAGLAAKDRSALLCQLNSYARPAQEVVA